MVFGSDEVAVDVECLTKFIEEHIVVFTIVLNGFQVPMPQQLHSAKYLDINFFVVSGNVGRFRPQGAWGSRVQEPIPFKHHDINNDMLLDVGHRRFCPHYCVKGKQKYCATVALIGDLADDGIDLI